MRSPARLVTGAVSAATALGTSVLLAGSAWAAEPTPPPPNTFDNQKGLDPGPSLSFGQTVLFFVVIPLTLFVVIALLAAAPSLAKRPKYRPGVAWSNDPVWFGGPDDPIGALESTNRREPTGGGASGQW